MSYRDSLSADFHYTRVFDMNRPTLGIMLRPRGSDRSNKICLQIIGRPTSPHGKAQGDHTLAWSAIARSLEWLFKDVTLLEAVSNVELLHRGLNVMRSSFSAAEVLIDTSDAIYRAITVPYGSKELLCAWITEYLMYYCHIRNAQPEASVLTAKNSGGKGEAAALKNLKTLESSLSKGYVEGAQTEAVQNLSTLIDKSAVSAFVARSGQGNRTESFQRIVTFQLFGIHDLFQALPNISRLLLRGSKGADLLSAGSNQVPEELLSNLATIILYSNGQMPGDREHLANKETIRKALTSIAQSA